MRVVVLEGCVQVGIAIKKVGSSLRSSSGTYSSQRLGIRVIRNEFTAWDLAVVELQILAEGSTYVQSTYLVNHQGFESVSHRVQVINPSKPRVHVSSRDNETSVDNQS